MSRVYEESGIEFDFGASQSCEKHDDEHANRVFQGVDFLVEEPTHWIWLEVKNWEPSTLLPRERSGARRKFLAAMRPRNGYFTRVLRAKFLSTMAYLALTGQMPNKRIVYVMLLETPKMDSAMKTHARDIMRGQIPQNGTKHVRWLFSISIVVADLATWQTKFPQYPTRRL